MIVGSMDKHEEQSGFKETEQQKRSQRIIIVLFFLAMISAGAFILLRLLAERMP
jgi:hypothetical protein